MAAISLLVPILGKVLDKVLPNKEEREKAQAELLQQITSQDVKILEEQMKAIVAEAQGESWMQSNWRPLTMLTFVVIIFNNHILAPYINLMFSVKAPVLELSIEMWELLKLGLGGYVAGRSMEKIADSISGALAKRK